jgi:hypothetical protein
MPRWRAGARIRGFLGKSKDYLQYVRTFLTALLLGRKLAMTDQLQADLRAGHPGAFVVLDL